VVNAVAGEDAQARLAGALGAVVGRLLGVFALGGRSVSLATQAHFAALAGILLFLRGRQALQGVLLRQPGHVFRLRVGGQVRLCEAWRGGSDGCDFH
jgi:hypothetical protein